MASLRNLNRHKTSNFCFFVCPSTMMLLQHLLFFIPPTLFKSPKAAWSPDATLPIETIYDIWLASRESRTNPWEPKPHETGLLAPGAHRPVTFSNVLLAYNILRNHAFEMFRTIWVPRTSLVLIFNICRGFFPAFRGYSQALIIDEVWHAFSSVSRQMLIANSSNPFSRPRVSLGLGYCDF